MQLGQHGWFGGASVSTERMTGAISWALQLLHTYTANPDTIFPGIVARTGDLRRMAKAQPDVQCVGDFDGGPS